MLVESTPPLAQRAPCACAAAQPAASSARYCAGVPLHEAGVVGSSSTTSAATAPFQRSSAAPTVAWYAATFAGGPPFASTTTSFRPCATAASQLAQAAGLSASEAMLCGAG